MRIVYYARRLRTLGRFVAPDPWLGNRPSEFAIDEYVMMPGGAAKAVDSSQFAHRIGLRSELDGTDHLIPESLYELWRRGQVPAERMPALARAIEPRVLKEDLNLILNQSMAKTFWIPLAAVFAVGLGVSFFAPIDDVHLSPLAAIGISTALTVLVAAVFLIVRQQGRARREQQMRWLLQVNSGAASAAVPEGRGAGRLKMFVKLYVTLLLGAGLLIGGAALWISRGGSIPDPPGSAQRASTSGKAEDIQTSVTITPAEAASGKTVTITVPRNDEQLTLKIPPGVHDGSRLRLRGKGVAGMPGVTPGDLYVTIHLR